MEQFLAVALVHFLTLLIPGVDFFLITRTAMSSGWRNATGTCLGIAVANGIFIAAAFSGLALISHPAVLNSIQVAGGAFLIYIGTAFVRFKERSGLHEQTLMERATWARNFRLGLASGLLNPKNALFYLSLAATLTQASPLRLVAYGVWMFSVVLAWDIFVAVALGTKRAPAALVFWISKAAGAFLVLFGMGMIGTMVLRWWN